ncbi:hypothetical protein ABIA25_006501 [Sinorhizobium fredii]|uniref:hypothetical protein n=1 Tax=Rhizobium fredii TaxID=380 RepID=UPI003513C681
MVLTQTTTVRANPLFEQLVQIGLKARTRAFLVGLAEQAIAGNVGNHDGGKPALHLPFRMDEDIRSVLYRNTSHF